MRNRLKIQPPHPVFTEQNSGSLQSVAYVEENEQLYLQFMLRREPENLARHVRYIFSLLKMTPVSRDALFGALVDLFIVLEDKGLALRRRMLVAAQASLPLSDVEFLRAHLSQGLQANAVINDAGLSTLTQSYSGSSAVLHKAKSMNQPELSLYEQAVSLLEYGDIDEAASLLEQALQQQPSDQQIADELLAIYQHQQNDHGIDAIRHWFIQNDYALPNNWPLL